jgi:hypothetical protein
MSSKATIGEWKTSIVVIMVGVGATIAGAGCKTGEEPEEPTAASAQAYSSCDAVCAMAGWGACAALAVPVGVGASVVATPAGGVAAGGATEFICGEIWDEAVCNSWCDSTGSKYKSVCWNSDPAQGCVTCCQEIYGCNTECAYPHAW